MARGWESKAVADQIEEGQKRPLRDQAANVRERERQSKLESLRLSRSRLLDQLDKARQVAHREVLLKGLAAIERQLEEVSAQVESSDED
jgi:hypothetical protein